jgi:hypothetical protein
MPLWAAICAASSTPEFFAPIIDRPEWQSSLQEGKIRRIS